MSAPAIDQPDTLSRLIPSRTARGFFLAVLSGIFFNFLNASVKELASEMPPLYVAWGRWVAGVALIAPYLFWRAGERTNAIPVFRQLRAFSGRFDLDTPLTQVGRDELPEAYTVDRLEAHGIPMQIRKDPRAPAALLAASRLCDQSLYQLALELDGETSVTHRLTVRTQRGATKSRWRSFGRVDATFDGVLADPRELRPLILRYAAEVADRRRTMGHR